VPKLSLAVQYAAGDAAAQPARAQVRRWVAAALERDARITVRYVDEDEGRALNWDYRRRDYATNVLTFVYGEDGDDVLAGDIVLCVPVLEREAAAQGKEALAHHAHLVVHGVLHLQGFDHEHEAEAAAMEMRETRILGKLGFPDPYAARQRRPRAATRTATR
jgi:probable rRNA maturation factor